MQNNTQLQLKTREDLTYITPVVTSGIVLTTNEQEIIKATQSEKLCNLDITELMVGIKSLIKMTYFNAGFSIKGDNDIDKSDNLILMTKSVIKEIITPYKNLTLAEIEIAFRRGVLKRYGEYMGISVVSLVNWIICYQNERMDAIFRNKQLLEKAEAENVTKSPEEREQIMKDFSHRAFAEFKEKGIFLDYGNAVYSFLDEKGLIKFTGDEKRGFMDTARMNLQIDSELSLVSESPNHFKRQEIMSFISKLSDKDKSIEARVISEAKQVALNLFFNITNTLEL